MGVGPIPATRKALERAGLDVEDLDLVELNEAFASQSIACIRELGLDPARVNVNGGAIALGHPLGMSGARLVTMLVHELGRAGGRYGLATMCIGVGQGIATIVERIDRRGRRRPRSRSERRSMVAVDHLRGGDLLVGCGSAAQQPDDGHRPDARPESRASATPEPPASSEEPDRRGLRGRLPAPEGRSTDRPR